MIRSMTAFASGERPTSWGTLSCDLRAVNHRFFELGLRLPEELRPLEAAFRERIALKLSRGKIDVSLRCRAPEGAQAALNPNASLLARLSELALDLDSRFPSLRTDFVDLLRFPGVLTETVVDQVGLQAEAMLLLDATLNEFVAAREREGVVVLSVVEGKHGPSGGFYGDPAVVWTPKARAMRGMNHPKTGKQNVITTVKTTPGMP